MLKPSVMFFQKKNEWLDFCSDYRLSVRVRLWCCDTVTAQSLPQRVCVRSRSRFTLSFSSARHFFFKRTLAFKCPANASPLKNKYTSLESDWKDAYESWERCSVSICTFLFKCFWATPSPAINSHGIWRYTPLCLTFKQNFCDYWPSFAAWLWEMSRADGSRRSQLMLQNISVMI